MITRGRDARRDASCVYAGRRGCLLRCPLRVVPGHARRYGIGPLAVLEAPQHGRASDLQALVAAERDHVTDGVVELDRGHAAADHGARIRASLNTCNTGHGD